MGRYEDNPAGILNPEFAVGLELFTMCEDEWDLFFDEDERNEVVTFHEAVDLVQKMMSE